MLIRNHTYKHTNNAATLNYNSCLLYCKLHIYYFKCTDDVGYVTRRVSDP